jgi:predicted membrane channel-forming protein YqfA (hemolysin III family)
MVAGSTTPPFYYGFICSGVSHYRWFYLSIVWVSSLAALACVLVPAFAKIHWVKAVAWSLALSSLIPGFVHLTSHPDERYMQTNYQVSTWILGLIFYAVGGIIFAMRMPECFIKKTFDIWGSSH